MVHDAQPDDHAGEGHVRSPPRPARRVARARVGAGGGARLERDHPSRRRPPRVGHPLTLSFEGGEAAGGGYDISAPETVAVEGARRRVLVGRTCRSAVVHHPCAVGPRLDVASHAECDAPCASNELALVGPASHPLYLTLDGSEWTHDVGRERDATLAVLRSLVSEQAEAAGWNAIVRVGLEPRHVARIDDATLRLTVPQFGLYSISVPETIGVSLPPAAVYPPQLSSSALLVVPPRAGRAFVSGVSLPRAARSAARRRRRSKSSCSATRHRFRRRRLGRFGPRRPSAELLGNLVAVQTVTLGWNGGDLRLARDVLRCAGCRRRGIEARSRRASFGGSANRDAPPRRPRRGGPLARGAAHGARRAHPPPRARLERRRRARPRRPMASCAPAASWSTAATAASSSTRRERST